MDDDDSPFFPTSPEVRLTTRQERKAQVLEAIYVGVESKSLDIGYQARHFTLTSLPIRKQKGLTWERRNGGLRLLLSANAKYGLPYGQDRLPLLWLVTQAVQRKTPEISFGAAAEILRTFDQAEDGQNYRRLMRRFQRIFGTTWFFGYVGRSGNAKVFEQESWRYVRRLRLWYSRDPEQRTLPGEDFQNLVELSPEFFAEIMAHKIPVEMQVVKYLKEHPGCLDFYTWLVYRSFTAAQSADPSGAFSAGVQIPLVDLAQQLGCASYSRSRRWRQKIGEWLGKVREVWPACPSSLAGDALVIRPAQRIPPRPPAA